MYRDKRIVAMIPARKGSKGYPGKNIRPLAGKPLIAWTIERAKRSRYIDRIIVSTDSKKILQISKKYGAEVPFLRPRKLADDKSKGVDVAFHLLKWMKKNNDACDILILLQPTSPLRTEGDIDKAIKSLFSKNAKAIASVCKTEHPYWSNRLPPDGCMKNFMKLKRTNINRQDTPVFYRLNGAIYLAYVGYFEKRKGFWGNNTFSYVMPEERSVDIDSKVDFELAKILMRH